MHVYKSTPHSKTFTFATKCHACPYQLLLRWHKHKETKGKKELWRIKNMVLQINTTSGIFKKKKKKKGA